MMKNRGMVPLVAVMVLTGLGIGGFLTLSDNPTIATPRHIIVEGIGESVGLSQSASSIIHQSNEVINIKNKRWYDIYQQDIKPMIEKYNNMDASIDAEGEVFTIALIEGDTILIRKTFEISEGDIIESTKEPEIYITITDEAAMELYNNRNKIDWVNLESTGNKELVKEAYYHWQSNNIKITPMKKILDIIKNFEVEE